MILHYLIAFTAFFGIFALFLVISKTLNNVINHLAKLHYLLQKELDIKKEQLEIGRLMQEENNTVAEDEENKPPASIETPTQKK